MKYICLGSFLAASSVFAFNPDATGWYGESAINTGLTHSSDIYRWQREIAPETTQWDLIFRQGVSYQRYITAEFQFLLGMDWAGASAGDDVHESATASNRTWRMDLDLFTSIDLGNKKSVYLEPVLGYEYLKEKIGYQESDGGGSGVDNRASAHGPKAGLYFRFYPIQNFSFRIGSSFLMLAFTDGEGVENDNEVYYIRRTKLSNGRKGLSTSISMSYSPQPYWTLEAAVESRTVASQASDLSVDSNTAVSHYLTQNSISWGVRWNY